MLCVIYCLVDVSLSYARLTFSSQVKQPIIFLSGLQDELVPPSHMRLLYEKAFEHNKNCRFVDFPNGMHMDTWNSGGDRYWRTIQLFLDQYAPEVQSCNTSCKSEIANDGKFSILSIKKFLKTVLLSSFPFALLTRSIYSEVLYCVYCIRLFICRQIFFLIN